MIDRFQHRGQRLVSFQTGIFFFIHTLDCFKGAGADTGGLQAVFQANEATVTLDDLAVTGVELGYAEGAGHGAAVATDAFAAVVNCHASRWILLQAANGTAHHTGSIRTMAAGDGKVFTVAALFSEVFVFADPAEGLVTRAYISVVLVHAGNRAGAAGAAFVRIIDDVVFHIAYASTFLILQRMDLYPGKPE